MVRPNPKSDELILSFAEKELKMVIKREARGIKVIRDCTVHLFWFRLVISTVKVKSDKMNNNIAESAYMSTITEALVIVHLTMVRFHLSGFVLVRSFYKNL